MKNISEYLSTKEVDNKIYISNDSLLADFAFRIHIYNQKVKEKNEFYAEIATSFLSIRKKIIEDYELLYKNLSVPLKDFDESKKKDSEKLMFNIIVSSKILLDIFVCLVNTILFESPFLDKNQKNYVDLSKRKWPKETKLHPSWFPICRIMDSLSTEFELIKIMRNQLIHKGYTVAIFKDSTGTKICLGKYSFQMFNPLVDIDINITATYFTPENELKIDLFAEKIFITLSEIERELLENIERKIIVDKSNEAKYFNKELMLIEP